MRTVRCLLIAVCCMVAFSVATAVAQHAGEPDSAEVKAQVPVLSKFHVPIYKLWHTAWPQKDTAMMASLIPSITVGIEEIAKAELPGILRDKKSLWDENVKALKGIGTDYVAAMAGSALQPKLDVAEKLHAQYERLVRIVRPVLKEIDAFHTVLYRLYHYSLPGKQMESIAGAAQELRAKMDTLNAVTLPDRLKKREESFLAARAKLSASVDAVNAVVPSKDMTKITKAIETMHNEYQALERVFE